jgi:hypothetical protein
MGDILFKSTWDSGDDNVVIYAATETAPGRCASKREIVVMLSKVPTARLWCHRREVGKITEFVACINDAKTPLMVDKGIHPDKYAKSFGNHMSVAVEWGAHAGLKCHLYGHLFAREMGVRVWEVDVITLYDPKISYRDSDLVLLQQGTAPAPPIVVTASGVPPATYGSIAYQQGGWVL